MGIVKQKTFSATTMGALDQLVIDFIGRHTVDGRSLQREPKFFEFSFVAPNFYVCLIYEETPLSN